MILRNCASSVASDEPIFTARPHCMHAMQSAVIPTAIPSVRPSVRPSHAGTLSRPMDIELRGLLCDVAKTLVF